MSSNKITFTANLPLMPGSISSASGTCGKPNCACKASPPKLHGTYYRWTGFLDGKRTSKSISKKAADECARRIKNYHDLLKQIDRVAQKGLTNAPWKDSKKD